MRRLVLSGYHPRRITRFAGPLNRGLEFYRGLFGADGAPAFDEESTYPRDIHAATQGMLVFAYTGEDELAGRIVDWVVNKAGAATTGSTVFTPDASF